MIRKELESVATPSGCICPQIGWHRLGRCIPSWCDHSANATRASAAVAVLVFAAMAPTLSMTTQAAAVFENRLVHPPSNSAHPSVGMRVSQSDASRTMSRDGASIEQTLEMARHII